MQTLKPQTRKRRPASARERGVHLVEVAVVVPFLLILIGSAAEFGRYFYTYVTLTKATRVAARYISAKPFDNTEKDIAKNLAVCGTVASCGTATIMPGLAAANISITSAGGSGYYPETVTVAIVNYNYTPLLKLSAWAGVSGWSSVAVKPSTTMRYLVFN